MKAYQDHSNWKILLGVLVLLVVACGANNEAQVLPADTIFIGEHIIPMDGSQVEAVAIRGERIVATGTTAAVRAYQGAQTKMVDLGEKALLPGFIDAHGHLAIQARILDFANLSSPPVGQITSIIDLQARLRAFISEQEIPSGQWVIGYGYDESLLAEQRHPNRNDLDAVSDQHPILLIHVSAHLAAVNSLALAHHKIGADTPDPSGGHIRRFKGSQEPNGVLEETAAQSVIFGQLLANSDGFAEQTRRTLELYASYGITTVQDGAAAMRDVDVYRQIAAHTPLPIDLVAYPFVGLLSEEQRANFLATAYQNGFRLGGVKFVLDGSIQGKTGFLREPYTQPPPGKGADFQTSPTMSPAQYQDWLKPLIARKVPVLVHANGDAAIDMMMDGFEIALSEAPNPDHRAVIIHAQMMHKDQLDRAKALGLVPSFFSAHPYFWGDWHRQILGEDRAKNISPIRWAIDRNIPFTIHNDAPIVPPDMMFLVWVTVNRQTRSGYVLGPQQRTTAYEALYAITMGSAYQYFEETEKGSITVGKQADLVILANNPLTAAPDTLKDIQIIETISRGKTVFLAE